MVGFILCLILLLISLGIYIKNLNDDIVKSHISMCELGEGVMSGEAKVKREYFGLGYSVECHYEGGKVSVSKGGLFKGTNEIQK